MSKIPKDSNEPFEVKTIHQLVRLMKKYDLTAIDLIDSETKIRLRRRGPETGAVVYQAPAPVMSSATAQPPGSAISTPTSTPAAPPSNEQIIESPMVGTFYSSPSPDAPPYVAIGATIRADSTICVIEAMKVFTDIPAGISGILTETLVKNGQSVEFGQPLFRVRTS